MIFVKALLKLGGTLLKHPTLKRKAPHLKIFSVKVKYLESVICRHLPKACCLRLSKATKNYTNFQKTLPRMVLATTCYN